MRSIYLTTHFPRQDYDVEINIYMCNCGCCGYFTLYVFVAVAVI